MVTILAVVARIVANPLSNVFQKQLTQRSAEPLFIIAATHGLLTALALPLLLGRPLDALGVAFWANMLTAVGLAVAGNALLVYALRSRAAAATIARKGAEVKATLQKAFGYQGDSMHLPVQDLAAALPFYENVLGFRVLSRSDTPYKSAVLARDEVQMGLEENGGDPSQDGCAFHLKDLDALFAEFTAKGLAKERSEFDIEKHDGVPWKVLAG